MKRNLLSRRLGRSAALATALTVVGALVVACGSSGTTASTAPSSNGDLSIRISWTADLSSLPILTAAQQGYFGDQKLDVSATEVTDTTTLPSLAGHTFDVVCVTPTQFISAVASGIDLTAISTTTIDTTSDPTGGILVPKSSGLTSFKDLAGKTIGTPSVTGTMVLALRKFIKQQGGDPQSIKPLQAQASQLGDLLTAGRFQAITALQPILTVLTKQGFVNLGDPFRAIGPKSTNGLCVAPTSYVEAHPSMPAEFRAAVSQAGTWIKGNAAAASSLFVQKSGVPAASMQGVTLPQVSAPVMTDDLTAWQNLMSEMGVLKKKIDIASHVSS